MLLGSAGIPTCRQNLFCGQNLIRLSDPLIYVGHTTLMGGWEDALRANFRNVTGFVMTQAGVCMCVNIAEVNALTFVKPHAHCMPLSF